MTRKEFNNLGPGDIVKNALTGAAYVVTEGTSGSFVVAVRTLVIRNEHEWVLVKGHEDHGAKED
jgi:hypothetical protein